MPRDTLTREQIITVAVDLLDDEGLEGLNMRALGKRLDSAPTAVYWHVGSKDALVVMAADRIWSSLPLPDPQELGWRAVAEQMAGDLYAALTRHPWLVQAFGSYFLYGAGKARYDDHTLAVYETGGFKGERADQAAATMLTYVLGNSLGAAAQSSLMRKLGPEGDADERLRELTAKAVAVAEQFPRLRTRLGSAATEYGAGPEGSFAFGLRVLLDGLESRLTAGTGCDNHKSLCRMVLVMTRPAVFEPAATTVHVATSKGHAEPLEAGDHVAGCSDRGVRPRVRGD
jgi:AcrR family transcriptional regulator